MSDFLAFFVVQLNNFKLKGGLNFLDIKLNVKSTFKTDVDKREEFIELFNYRLLKIIIYLETHGGTN